MTTMAHRTRTTLLLLGVTLAACRGDSSTAPRSASVDVDALLAEASPTSIVSAAEAARAATPLASALSVAPAVSSKDCAWTAASSSFVCPSRTVNGLTFTRAFVLLDAAGHPLTTADRSLLAAIRTTTTVAGTTTAGGIGGASSTLTIDERNESTLSGLLAGPHVLDATSSSKIDGKTTFDGVTAPFTSEGTQQVQHLVLPTTRGGWPASGKIVIDESSRFGNEVGPTATHLEMTFDGTSRVAVTMTVGGVTSHCTIDLASQLPMCG